MLEAFRRFWWRAFDRVCYCIVLIRLSLFDRIYGPEPSTSADLKREADREQLVRALPAAGELIERWLRTKTATAETKAVVVMQRGRSAQRYVRL
jgi:hypothetical protein